MTQRLCPRCHHAISIEDEGALIFCSNCGAPLVLLSEELRSHAEQLQQTTHESASAVATARPDPPPDPFAVDWKTMIRVSALVAGVFTFLSLCIPPLALLVPAIALALYNARHRQTPITTALGTRVGVLCGLFTVTGISLVSAVALLLSRFGTHQMGDFDKWFDALILNTKTQVIAQQGQAAPEFRAGWTFGVFAMLMAAFAVLSLAGGALAGFIRSHARAR